MISENKDYSLAEDLSLYGKHVRGEERFDDIFDMESSMLFISYINEKGWQEPKLCSSEIFKSEYIGGNTRCTADVIAGIGGNSVINIFRPEETVMGLLAECMIKQIPVIDDDLLVEYIRGFAKLKKDIIPPAEKGVLDISIRVDGAENGYEIFFSGKAAALDSKNINLYSDNGTCGFKSGVRSKNRTDIPFFTDGNGNICGCFNANIFICEGNRAVTPPAPLGSGIYSDIMRDTAIRLMKDNGIKVEERLYPLKSLFDAKKSGLGAEIFITNIIGGICSVKEINCSGQILSLDAERNIGITEMLREKMFKLLSGRDEDAFKWILYANKSH